MLALALAHFAIFTFTVFVIKEAGFTTTDFAISFKVFAIFMCADCSAFCCDDPHAFLTSATGAFGKPAVESLNTVRFIIANLSASTGARKTRVTFRTTARFFARHAIVGGTKPRATGFCVAIVDIASFVARRSCTVV